MSTTTHVGEPDARGIDHAEVRNGRLLHVPPAVRDAGLLLARLVFGGVLFAHGLQKLTQFGLDGVAGNFGKLGVPLPELTAAFAAFVELAGGLLLILGLLTPLAGLLVVIDMIGAWWFAHRDNGVFVQDGGWELVAVIAAGALALSLVGPGRWSLDALIAARRAKR